MRPPLVFRVLALLTIAALAPACSSDGGATNAGSTVATVTPGGSGATDGSGPTTTLAPTTTFMPDCSAMPTTEAISAAVGIPVDVGQVVGSGTCQFLGLNDQSKSVTLGMYTDPVDQAAFTDLQTSLGATTPYPDAALPGAQVGVDNSVFVVANGAIYTVLTMVTDQSPAEQVPLSAALLKAWLPL